MTTENENNTQEASSVPRLVRRALAQLVEREGGELIFPLEGLETGPTLWLEIADGALHVAAEAPSDKLCRPADSDAGAQGKESNEK